MTRAEVLEYVRLEYGTEPDYPWHDDNAVLRHAGNGKWYGLLMKIRRDRLGLPGQELFDVMNVKCDPILVGALRSQEGFRPAYHMNKERWITILLDGSAPEALVKQLIDMSFSATAAKPKAGAARKGRA